jgi:sugar phosphate isomerase/epimerase
MSTPNDTSLAISRRQWLTATAATGMGAATAATVADDTAGRVAQASRESGFAVRYCLNTSTLSGQKLSLPDQIDVAAKAGYDGIEPWMRDIDQFVGSGGKTADLRKRLADANLTVESAIGFAQWIVDDEGQRKAGLEQLKRDMDRVRELGGTRIAAPPVGAHQKEAPQIDLFTIADRYRAALEVGVQTGVVPQAEVWGFSKNLSRLGETIFVCVESGHPKACLLPDIYHIHRGGSAFTGLQLLSAEAFRVFHVNDYPTSKPRMELNDADRVYPGDGDAPLGAIMDSLRAIGFRGALSLELFNRDYWKQDPLEVARTGLAKMRAMVGQGG